MQNNLKVSFMFGAGAESKGNFNIQNGNDFLINTIYTEKRIYKELLKEKFKIEANSLVGLSSIKVSEEFLNKLFCMYILLLYDYKINKKKFITDELSNKIKFKDFISKKDKTIIYVTKDSLISELNKKLKINQSTDNIKLINVGENETNEDIVERIFEELKK